MQEQVKSVEINTKYSCNDRINDKKLQLAIKNFNYASHNRILPAEFDLELIYKNKNFKFNINNYNIISNSKQLDFTNVIFSHDLYVDYLLMIVMDVFSNLINCAYFLKDELNSIFSLFTLSPKSQMLFVRLFKRKLGWHRMSSLNYPEISNNLEPCFKELLKTGYCISDLDSVDISILLNMLQVHEIKNICQKLKISHNENKAVLIKNLVKYGFSSKLFFIGAKTPKSVLRSIVQQILKPCICLSQNIINLFNRVLILFYPTQDPTENIADLFQMLTNIEKNELLFPPILKKESFPVFKNRTQLIDYSESKNILKQIFKFIERKEWDEVRNLGRLALKYLTETQTMNTNSSLPLHVQKFIPKYLWFKVLDKSIEAFKKTPEAILEAINILKILINEKNFFQSNQSKWYCELALIEMHYQKNLERSAALTLHALNQDMLTEIDVLKLSRRLKKLMNRKSGISKKTKILIEKTQKKITSNCLTQEFMATKIKNITAQMTHRKEDTGKSMWSVNINDDNKYYGNVEMLALHHYINEESFHEGLHCEGLLAVTLFAVYFWDELYNIFVPGSFISPYQDAPLDLFTAEFCSNREKSILTKIKCIYKLDLQTFTDWMEERYSNCIQFRSIMPNTLFKTNQQFKEVVACLGIHGVTGICEKLISNFKIWRSGFPDLIVWNTLNLKCKIVEVKGPNDILSEKQNLWLQYLQKLGIEAEVCYVKGIKHFFYVIIKEIVMLLIFLLHCFYTNPKHFEDLFLNNNKNENNFHNLDNS